jgi:hypothetical protein
LFLILVKYWEIEILWIWIVGLMDGLKRVEVGVGMDWKLAYLGKYWEIEILWIWIVGLMDGLKRVEVGVGVDWKFVYLRKFFEGFVVELK